jgi:hypothetical protein
MNSVPERHAMFSDVCFDAPRAVSQRGICAKPVSNAPKQGFKAFATAIQKNVLYPLMPFNREEWAVIWIDRTGVDDVLGRFKRILPAKTGVKVVERCWQINGRDNIFRAKENAQILPRTGEGVICSESGSERVEEFVWKDLGNVADGGVWRTTALLLAGQIGSKKKKGTRRACPSGMDFVVGMACFFADLT